MKKICRTAYYLGLCILFTACEPSINVSTPTLESNSILIPHTPTTSPTVEFTDAPGQHSPRATLIPTIESAKIADLLKSSLSIENLSAFHGHNMQRITGWPNGFNNGMGQANPYGWMDASHILLFPVTGETESPNWRTITAYPVVMDIHSGKIWFPPTDRSFNKSRWFRIILPRWSPKLQVLVTGENLGQEEGVSTFTADGKQIEHYAGQLIDISPSAEKIFIDGNTWMDLGSGRQVDFGWERGFGDEVARWSPIWSYDENQIYFCCYYYGNAQTGQSYTIPNEDTIFDGKPFVNQRSLRHAYGEWLSDDLVLAQYDAWWYTGPEFSIFFDISERTYHNFGAVTGLPAAFNNNAPSYKSISPSGEYMYVTPGAQSSTDPEIYLIDLKTLKSTLYHAFGMNWSANGKYAILEPQVLTLSDKTLRTLPIQTDSVDALYWIARIWHPTEGALVSIYADKQQHMIVNLLDVETFTEREREFALPSNFTGTYYYTHPTIITWSPLGDRFALRAADGSLWLMEYPNLEKLEQLTPPMTNVKDISWSPDGKYVSYDNGTDIYMVEVEIQP